MDPASAIGLAFNIIEIIKVLQRTYETIKDAPAALEQVVSQANKLDGVLKRLRSIEPFLSKDRKKFLAEQINFKECESTLKDLKQLVDQIKYGSKGAAKGGGKEKEMSLKQKVQWFLKESDAKRLSERMEKQAQRIANATDQILLESGLHVEKEILELRKALMAQLQPVVTSPESETTQDDGFATWFGHYQLKPGQNPDMPYFKQRKGLADALYYGKMESAIDLIEGGKKSFNQAWANACYIALNDGKKHVPSGYTALHQAAWHGAPTKIVEKLINQGAWRLARTVSNGKQNTPLDIAREFGWTHLIPLLTPVVYHPLPPQTLHALQSNWHKLMNKIYNHAEVADITCLHLFRLPDVEILTELKNPQMWVPLQPERWNDKRAIGVHIYLDGRELVMKAIKAHGRTVMFRIQEDGWEEIERGILLKR